jgi:hypothetical protein
MSALREIPEPRQVRNESRRRWFYSAACELVVWLDEAGNAIGFQFSYDKADRQHSLTWRVPDRFLHTGIDSGETHPLKHKAAPILAADGIFDAARIVEIFRGASAELPHAYAELVEGKIREFGARAETRAAQRE